MKKRFSSVLIFPMVCLAACASAGTETSSSSDAIASSRDDLSSSEIISSPDETTSQEPLTSHENLVFTIIQCELLTMDFESGLPTFGEELNYVTNFEFEYGHYMTREDYDYIEGKLNHTYEHVADSPYFTGWYSFTGIYSTKIASRETFFPLDENVYEGGIYYFGVY